MLEKQKLHVISLYKHISLESLWWFYSCILACMFHYSAISILQLHLHISDSSVSVQLQYRRGLAATWHSSRYGLLSIQLPMFWTKVFTTLSMPAIAFVLRLMSQGKELTRPESKLGQLFLSANLTHHVNKCQYKKGNKDCMVEQWGCCPLLACFCSSLKLT